ncbi:MAG TPA: stage III sporulation protein AF [Firmicutes bacterium]|nr:stage III sporulation protein AF [Bacillota bacterium]
MSLLDYLRDWVKQLILIVILAGFIDLVLPTGSTRKFARVVVGLFVIMALFNPLLLLLRQDVSWRIPRFEESVMDRGEMREVTSQDEVLAATVQEQALAHYRRQLEEQAKALVLSLEEVSEARAKVYLEEGAGEEGGVGIAGLAIWVKQGSESGEEVPVVEKVVVKIDNGEETSLAGRESSALPAVLKEKITAVLTTFYNIEPDAISIFASDKDVYD